MQPGPHGASRLQPRSLARRPTPPAPRHQDSSIHTSSVAVEAGSKAVRIGSKSTPTLLLPCRGRWLGEAETDGARREATRSAKPKSTVEPDAAGCFRSAERAFGAPHPSRRFAARHLPLQGRKDHASLVHVQIQRCSHRLATRTRGDRRRSLLRSRPSDERRWPPCACVSPHPGAEPTPVIQPSHVPPTHGHACPRDREGPPS